MFRNFIHFRVIVKENPLPPLKPAQVERVRVGDIQVYCVKSPFNLIVIPDLIKLAPYLIRGNPLFSIGFQPESTPYLLRGGNDEFGTNVKKRWTHYNSFVKSFKVVF